MFKVTFIDTLGWIKIGSFVTSHKDEIATFLSRYGFSPMIDFENNYEEITRDGLSVTVEVK